MASSDIWLDFEQVRHNIKNNTVDKLKQILTGLNEECGMHFPKSGKKQEIIDRIVATLDTWRTTNLEDNWVKARAVVYQVRNTGIYTPTRLPVNPAVLPTTSHAHNSYHLSGISKPPLFPGIAGTSTLNRYDPYAPPRKATGSSTSIPPTSTGPKSSGIRFKESPFYQVDQAVSAVTECPESTGATDRRQQVVTFSLTNDQLAKLKLPGSQYQLRLFCTSSIFYSPPNSFRTSTIPCPIEFPPTCEVRVNNVQLTANLKGLKKKPGTAPPPDLGKYARLTNVQNRVEMVYVNSQQPIQSKKYYLVVMLVEITTVDRLVSTLKSGSYRNCQDIRQKSYNLSFHDDDIIAGPQKMSLKCPLSFMRINTPCRSSRCVHSQCFDATSWFSVMEQTTTWLCPVCERILDCKDLIIDGYFDEILKHSPENVEDVIVEADGEWHTSDNKYGSAQWKATHTPIAVTKPAILSRKPSVVAHPPSSSPSKLGPDDLKEKTNVKDHEIFILDSDDEDEGQVKRELSPSFGSATSGYQSFESSATSVPQSQSQTDDVIDLTLDSDDEAPVVSQKAGKRKATDAELSSTSPTEQIWKKSRPDPDRTVPTRVSINTDYPILSSHSVAPRSPLQYTPSFQPGSSLGSTFSPFNIRSTTNMTLPPLQNVPPRTNGHWS
ncbi:PINIT domain-containing protein [Collybia nuda]|uniref:PINIT domain-containing protein n=1 Tax=Collybia nuda TaxID=64659 RepID=A0A9P6CCT6_9AGAR|nr:PINIT domain-containing protein [Collybia nuda]